MKRGSMSKSTMFFVKLFIVILIIAGILYLINMGLSVSREGVSVMSKNSKQVQVSQLGSQPGQPRQDLTFKNQSS